MATFDQGFATTQAHTDGNHLGSNEQPMTEVIFPHGIGNPAPLVSEVWGVPPAEAKTIPVEQLPLSERIRIEQLPAVPDGTVCVPLESGALGDVCKSSSTLTADEKSRLQESERIHLRTGDRVEAIPNGYLIIPPLPQIMD